MPPYISVIVNTACRGAKAQHILSSGKVRHAERYWLLKDRILPRLIHDPAVAEVFVVGEYEPGAGYRYIESPSVAFDCTDALHQRQTGFEASSAPVCLFLHDDHLPGIRFFEALLPRFTYDVLVPQRCCRQGDGWLRLNNGSEAGYVMGHAVLMQRAVAEHAPWGLVPKVFTWDVEHTKMIREAKHTIEWAPVNSRVCVWDLEAEIGATPWR